MSAFLQEARPVVIAVPARDEAERITECLRAIATQRGAAAPVVLLFVNNSVDHTAAVARRLAPSLGAVQLRIMEYKLPPDAVNAGAARRLAMSHAAEIAGRDGLLLTTDADGRIAPDWLAANLAALRAGADVVCGRAEIDLPEALLIPNHLHEDDRLECAYGDLLDELHARHDPDPHDPWPRHTEHSGASIAVTVKAFHRVGGVPALPNGEDRAFLAALRRVDARIRHAPEVRVIVSGRTEGRAIGGMADTMRRRIVRQDELLDARLEPALDCVRRARARSAVRRLWQASSSGESISQDNSTDGHATLAALAAKLRLQPWTVTEAIKATYFGAAWSNIEGISPVLRWRRVPRKFVMIETERAKRLLRSAPPHTMPSLSSAYHRPAKLFVLA